jgi:glycogen(starch) synthase
MALPRTGAAAIELRDSLLMRVLFWSEQFWPQIGGIEVWGTRLLRALRGRGHEYTVVTSRDDIALRNEDLYEGIPVYRFPFWTALADRNVGQLGKIIRAVAQIKRAVAPDLVHLNLTGPSVYFHLQTADAHPAPLLVSLHQPLQNPSGGSDAVASRILRAADWVTAASEMVHTTAQRIAPEIAPRSSLIHFGFDACDARPEPLPFDEPRLLCLGRHVFEKGFDLALTAFSTLVGRFPKLRMIIASDGPARPDLERQTAELGLTEAVDFIGWVESAKIPALLNSATVVLVPSRVIEGFGLVAMEAAMMGRPVVATRSGGLSEVVIDGQTGSIVERENCDALAAAIAHLLDHPDVAAEMGRAARNRAQAMFGWERHVDAFEALYRRLTNGCSRH